MPFKSKAQAAYLKDHLPKVFKEYKAATPLGIKLPGRIRKTVKK